MAVLVSDSFNRANSTSTLGTTDNINGGTAKTWQYTNSTWGINTNRAQQESGSTDASCAYVDTGAGNNNVTVQVTVTGSMFDPILASRIVVTPISYLSFQASSSGYVLYDYSGGSWVTLGSSSRVPVAGDVMKITLNASAITCYINGTQIFPATSTRNQSSTLFGMNGQGLNSNTFDMFQVDDLISGGTVNTRTLTDSIVVSETVSKKTGKARSDSIVASESIRKNWSGARTESIGITDSIAASSAKVISVIDSVAMNESSIKQIQTAKTDTVTSLDAVSKSLVVMVVDAVSTIELINKFDSSLNISDTLSVSDILSLSSAMGKAINLSDAISITESIEKVISSFQTDSIITTETETSTSSKQLADTLSASDSIIATNGKAINLADSVVIVDSIQKTLSKLHSDSVITSESESDTTSKQLFDIVSQVDSIAISGGKIVVLTDNVSVSELLTKSLQHLQVDAVSLSDTLSRGAIANIVTLYDVVLTTDTLTRYSPNAPTLIGTIELQGEQTLYVYLIGEKTLNVNLSGLQELYVSLQGGFSEMAKQKQDFEMFAGESKIITIPIVNQTGIPLNLSGASIRWAIKRSETYGTNEVLKTATDGIAISVPTTGIITITLNPNDTENLSGKYYHVAELIDANQNVSTVVTGYVTISKSGL